MASTNEPIKEKKSKWKLSSLRHHDKDVTENDSNTTTQAPATTLQTPASTTANLNPSHENVSVDSTYGGSSTRDSAASGQFPTISNQQAQEQNAPLHTRTDQSTGRKIVTTTTTTTTTVTTVDGDHVEVPAGQEVRVTETKKETVPAELSAQPITPGVHHQLDPIAGATKTKTRTPSPQPPAPAAVIERYGGTAASTGSDSPVSPMRPSVSHNNFSYPARPSGTQVPTSQYGPGTGAGAQDSYQPYRGSNNTSLNDSPQQPLRQNQRKYYDDVPHDEDYHDQHVSFQQPGEQPGHPGYGHGPGTAGHHQTGYGTGIGNHPSTNYGPGSTNQPMTNQPGFNPAATHPPAQTNYGPGSTTHTPVNQSGYNQSGSYAPPPTQTAPLQQQQSQPQQRMGTLAGLKAAAAGIHGAGETLRGTLNSSIERRTGGDPSRVAANDAIAQHGMQEIQTGRFHHPEREGYVPPKGTAVTPSTSATAQTGHQPGQPGAAGPGQRYDPLEGQWVGNDNAGAVGAEEKKKGGLRNVLRRKEVSGR